MLLKSKEHKELDLELIKVLSYSSNVPDELLVKMVLKDCCDKYSRTGSPLAEDITVDLTRRILDRSPELRQVVREARQLNQYAAVREYCEHFGPMPSRPADSFN
jgi:hypothetical protein